MDEWMNEKPNLETDPELNSMCLGFRVSKMRGGEGAKTMSTPQSLVRINDMFRARLLARWLARREHLINVSYSCLVISHEEGTT